MLLALDKFYSRPPPRVSSEHAVFQHTHSATFFPPSSVWISVEASYQFLFRAIEEGKKQQKQKKNMCVNV